MEKINVLVADDHHMIVEGLGFVLARYDIEVVATATTAEEVVEKFFTTSPDVTVLDVRFGSKKSGLEVAREILAIAPRARFIFHSQFDQAALLREAYETGALSFVTKTAPPGLLATAIRQAHEGKTFFLPEIAERLALTIVHRTESPATKLDARELNVFRRMAVGETNMEIAEALELSAKTISLVSHSKKS